MAGSPVAFCNGRSGAAADPRHHHRCEHAHLLAEAGGGCVGVLGGEHASIDHGAAQALEREP